MEQPENHHRYLGREWGEKAEANVEEWGFQDIEVLLLAAQEELGELSQAYLETVHEGGDPERVEDELDDLAALCFQMKWALAGFEEV